MTTLHLQATDPGAIEQAAALLRAGRLVVFPTDTVYGIGAAAFSQEAIAALYRAKVRPVAKGIPLLLADESDLQAVARAIPESARSLARRFWPGALTLILPRRSNLPPNLSPNENVAVRIPDNEIARNLIRAAGGAVAATSANRSGEPPATNAGLALETFDGIAAAVLDGGPARHGEPSTIVDCTSEPPTILRAGALSSDALGLSSQPEA
jgi:L-threonylcarbamoyladenylate synthase